MTAFPVGSVPRTRRPARLGTRHQVVLFNLWAGDRVLTAFYDRETSRA